MKYLEKINLLYFKNSIKTRPTFWQNRQNYVGLCSNFIL